jgi:hypothetical protein
MCALVCVCVCAREGGGLARARACVCVYVSVYICGGSGLCVCVCVSVCVCVCWRPRSAERLRPSDSGALQRVPACRGEPSTCRKTLHTQTCVYTLFKCASHICTRMQEVHGARVHTHTDMDVCGTHTHTHTHIPCHGAMNSAPWARLGSDIKRAGGVVGPRQRQLKGCHGFA